MKVTRTRLFGAIDLISPFRKFSSNLNAVSHALSDFMTSSKLNYDIAKDNSIKERTTVYPVGKRLNYTYGEVPLESLCQIFDIIYNHSIHNPSSNQVLCNSSGGLFYDLGKPFKLINVD